MKKFSVVLSTVMTERVIVVIKSYDNYIEANALYESIRKPIEFANDDLRVDIFINNVGE